MEEMTKHGKIGQASAKAGMDRKTARKYVEAGKLPSQMSTARLWRTREDPFEEHWGELEGLLTESPGLEAKTLLRVLMERFPGRYEPGQVRTLQRRIRLWRAQRGPEKEAMLAQRHRPGEAAQTDFTSVAELGVTIAGQLLAHLLCVVVLPFSNWRWATDCLSESIAALRKGIQRALFQLGRVPEWHQTDHSTAATHRLSEEQSEGAEGGRRRPFNEEYMAIMRHFGMKPRTTEVGAKEQNGDVEAGNGVIKRRLEQRLLLRASRDFESVEAWQAFVDETLREMNREQGSRVAEELGAMRELAVSKIPEYVEEEVRVSEWSTVRIRRCAYSVPSRLIGEWVRARVFEDRIEIWHGPTQQLACQRLVGRNQHRIDYRHIIWSLVRKPGAFSRYVYREEMFPSVTFRRAYDAIQSGQAGTKGDLEYLRILLLAASSLEADVEAALSLLLAEGKELTADDVKALMSDSTIQVPQLKASSVNLAQYDRLIEQVGA